MSGTTYAFRLQGSGADQLKSEFDKGISAGKEFQAAVEAIQGSGAAVAAGINSMSASIDRAGTSSDRSSRQMRAWTNTLNQVVAAVDPVEAAYVKAAKAEEALLNLHARGRPVTDAQVRGVQALRTAYEEMAHAVSAAGEADRRSQDARAASIAAAKQETAQLAARNAELDQAVTRYVPLIAVNQRYRDALQEIETLRKSGRLTSQQAEAAIDRETVAYERSREAITGRISDEERLRRATIQTAADTSRAVDSLNAYVRAADPVAAALAQVTKAEQDLATAQANGVATPAHMAAVRQLRTRYDELDGSTRKATGSVQLQRYQVQNLTAQFVDLGVQLSSGQGLFLPLIQQGPQAVDAVGGVRNAVSLLGRLITPVSVAVGGTVAVLGSMVLISDRNQAALLALSNRLRATRDDYTSLAQSVKDAADAVGANSAVGTSTARDAGAVIAGSRDYSASTRQLQDYIKLAADLATVMGIDVPAAAKEFISKAIDDPAAAARAATQAGLFGFNESLRRTVELMAAQGDQAGATQKVLDQYAKRVQGASEETTFLGRAWNSVGENIETAWQALNRFLDRSAKGLTTLPDTIGAQAIKARSSLTAAEQSLREFDEGNAGYQGSALPTQVQQQRQALVDAIDALREVIGKLPAQFRDAAPSRELASLTPTSSSADIRAAISAQAKLMGVPESIALGVATQESGVQQFRADGSVKRNGNATGIYQIMPALASDLNIDPADIQQNIIGGLRNLQQLMTRFADQSGNVDWSKAIAAYRAGPNGNVAQGKLSSVDYDYIDSVLKYAGLAGTGSIGGRAATVVGADRVANGVGDPRSVQIARREGQIGQLEAGLQVPDLSPEKADQYRESIKKLRAEIVGLQDPMDEMRRKGQLQAALFAEQSGAARTLAEAEQQAAETARGQGADATGQIIAGLEGRRQKQAELNDQLNQAIEKQEQQTAATVAAAGAMKLSARESEEAAIRKQAEIEALQYQTLGTDGYRDAVERLVKAKINQRSADVDLASSSLIDQQKAEMVSLQQQTTLITLSTEARQAELDVIKERKRVSDKGGDPDSDTSRQIQNNIRLLAQQRETNQQLQNSWNELGSIGERAFDRVGDALTTVFTIGKSQAVSFKSVMNGLITSIVNDMLKLAVINPVLNSVFGGTRGTLAGAVTAAGAAGTANASTGSANSSSSLLSLASGAKSIWDTLGSGTISKGIDAWGASNLSGLGLTNATSGAGLLNGGAALGGFSSLSNVLGIAGSALPGLMSGNYVQAGLGTAGAALGTIIAPGIGTIIGGAAGNLLGGLFGGKQGYSGGVAQVGVTDGRLAITDSGFKGYKDSAEAIASVNATLQTLNDSLTKIGLGFKAIENPDIGGTSFSEVGFGAAANPDAQKLMEEGIIRRLTSEDSNVNAYLDTVRDSGKGLDEVVANIEWIQQSYEPLVDSLRKAGTETGQFQQQLDSIRATYQEVIDTSSKLGLATDELTAAQTKAINAVYDQRDAVVNSVLGDYQTRYLRATGNGDAADLMAFDLNAKAQRESLAASMKDWSIEAQQASDLNLGLERTLAAERQQLLDQQIAATEQANTQAKEQARQTQQTLVTTNLQGLSTLRDFINNQLISGTGVSPQNSFLAAQQQYQSALDGARAGGDISAYTSAASTLLSANASYYGTSPQAAAIRSQVISTSQSLGEQLASATDPLVNGLDSLGADVRDLRASIDGFRNELRSARIRAA